MAANANTPRPSMPLPSMAIVNRHSRYEQLVRGDFGGTDVRLVFVDESSTPDDVSADAAEPAASNDKRLRGNGKKKGDGSGTKREVAAHKAFLRSCGLVRAAFEEDRFVESASGEVRIVVPPGTFGAVEGLLRWCYDGRCQPRLVKRATPYLVLESYATGIPALWALSDFVQCRELCEEILAALRAGRLLRTGSSFARLVEEATALGTTSVLEAALEGVPLHRDRRDELEIMLDWGSSEMLSALAKSYRQLERGSRDDEEDGEGGSASESTDTIIETLGEYLAEMARADRVEMQPSLIASYLVHFRPGTVSEADYATMVLDYLEDVADEVEKFSASALLASIDFSAISCENLVKEVLPRIERILPQYALVVNDFASNAAPVVTRCAYSAAILPPVDGEDIAYLPCGQFLSSAVARQVFPIYSCHYDYTTERMKTITVASINCPVCNERPQYQNHTIRHDDVIQRDQMNWWSKAFVNDRRGRHSLLADGLEFVNSPEKGRLWSYLRRKRAKLDALKKWALSCREEEECLTAYRPNKKVRVDETALVLQDRGTYVRIVNQCSRIGHETIECYSVDSSASTLRRSLDAVAKRSELPSCDSIGFFRNGEMLNLDNTWDQLRFGLAGAKDELIVARRRQVGGKPVIRIYSGNDIDDITVTLDLEEWSDVLTFPRALAETKVKHDGAFDECTTLTWSAKALGASTGHSSTIVHKATDGVEREYSYLFWEASTLSGFRISVPNASCVRSDELAGGILQDALVAQGLSVEEATEMATHWLPALCKKEFVVIEFMKQELLDKRAKLTIQPPPTLVHRVFMLFHPSDGDISCATPLVRSPPLAVDHTKYTVVEWGGMEC